MYCLQKLTLHGGTNIQIQHLKRWTQNHSGLTHQRATKLPVLYLLQVMYMTFQYLTVSCIHTMEYVANISIDVIPDIKI